MKTFERKEECPPVERIIWNKVSISWGDFGGIEELSFAELMELRSACGHQAQQILNKSTDEQ